MLKLMKNCHTHFWLEGKILPWNFYVTIISRISHLESLNCTVKISWQYLLRWQITWGSIRIQKFWLPGRLLKAMLFYIWIDNVRAVGRGADGWRANQLMKVWFQKWAIWEPATGIICGPFSFVTTIQPEIRPLLQKSCRVAYSILLSFDYDFCQPKLYNVIEDVANIDHKLGKLYVWTEIL